MTLLIPNIYVLYISSGSAMCGMSKPDGGTSWRLTRIVSGGVVNGHGGQQSQRVSRKIRGQKGNKGQVGYIYLLAEILYSYVSDGALRIF